MIRTMKRMLAWIQTMLTGIASHFDSKDIPAITFFLGLALLAYGAEQFSDGLGLALAGCLLVLSVHPIIRWWK